MTLSKEEVKKIIELYKNGFSYREISKLGFAQGTIAKHVKGLRNSREGTKLSYEKGNRKPATYNKEHYKRLSVEQSLNNRGGKCKWYDVSGKKVQGTWERNLAISFEKLGIQWLKPTSSDEIWKYFDAEGKEHSYTPDFYLPEFDTFIELKGYWWGNDREKMDIIKQRYPKRKLLIIEKDEYKVCLSLVN